jgi:nitrate/nitrite transport system ATP-binding protein
MSEPKFIEVQQVEMLFDTRKGRFHALTDVNLKVARGEFITLIGHSGCGKSTLLNLLAGLTRATEGVLICAGREIAGPAPERAVVFQNHSLLPWLTCFENVYLAVERVFGALDALTRAHLQDELLRIVAQTESTVVMVTHDVDEAVLLSDRIVMMTNGPAATIGEIVDVRLPRPRERVALAHDALYNEYRTRVLEFLYHRQARPAKEAA